MAADPHAPQGTSAAAEQTAADAERGDLEGQSIKSTARGGPYPDDEATKRTRHLLVDTRGLLLSVVVQPGISRIVPVRPGRLHGVQPALPRLERLWATAPTWWPLQTRVWRTFGWRLRIVGRPGGRGQWLRADQEPPIRLPGIHLQARSWVVERTGAGIARNRRMSRDEEFLPTISAT
jgi:hypothetical protein